MMTPQQMETYVLQLLRGQETQNAVQAQLNSSVNQLNVSIGAINSTLSGLSNSVVNNAVGIDTYLIGGRITHKLITLFQAAVTFASTILVTGIATFTAAPVLSALTASLPLQLTAGRAITSALISLTTAVSGILPRANGGLGNSSITPYAGTFSGTSAAGTFSGTITGTANLITGVVTGTCSGTTSSTAATGTTSTSV